MEMNKGVTIQETKPKPLPPPHTHLISSILDWLHSSCEVDLSVGISRCLPLSAGAAQAGAQVREEI